MDTNHSLENSQYKHTKELKQYPKQEIDHQETLHESAPHSLHELNPPVWTHGQLSGS